MPVVSVDVRFRGQSGHCRSLTYRDFMSTRRSLPPAEILIFRPEPFVDRGPARRNGHFPRSVYGAAFRES